MFWHYWQLVRFDKPIGFFLLLWPTLCALWIASAGAPKVSMVLIFVLGAFVMRTFGCLLNDLADMKFDYLVARTSKRMLTAKIIAPKHAIILSIIFGCVALWLLTFLNPLAIQLAMIAAVCTAIYPFCKRVTNFAQVFLGFTFSFGVLIAFAAIEQQLSWTAWSFYLLTVISVVAFDTIYGLVDREDDLQLGLHSLAIFFGQHARYYISGLQFIFMFGLIVFAVINQIHYSFLLWLVIAIVILIYEFFMLKDQAQYFAAFLRNNLVWMFIFIGLLTAYY